VALSHKTLAIAGVAKEGGRQIEVWTLSGSEWLHSQTLFVRACGVHTGHVSLSIDDDVIAVGCSSDPADDPEHAGGAFVFMRAGGTWVGPSSLRVADGKTGEFFGESVAVSADTVAVGAPLANVRTDAGETRNAAGAVYVFKRAGSSWKQQARLTARHPGEDDGFGAAVAVYGDTVAASAPFEDSAKTGIDQNGRDDDAPDSGAVYLFVRRAERWTEQAYIKASRRSDPAVTPQWGGNQFGGGDSSAGPSLALWGDTLAVGAPGEDWLRNASASDPEQRYISDAGAVYIFKRRDGRWSQDQRIVPAGLDSGGNFGMSIALQGNRMIVGAWQHLGVGAGLNDTQLPVRLAPPPGAAFGFERRATGFVEVARMGAAVPAAAERFGWSVAVSEHATVVGAPASTRATVAIFR
jgi:trimeric autotransporter adhesin